jgi:NAD(P) transhydrogenase
VKNLQSLLLDYLEVDLAVIGGGPAGQKGAIQGAKSGKRVAVIDRLGLMGGASLNQGTIPSKTLRSAILDLTGYQQSRYYGHTQKNPRRDFRGRSDQAH